MSLENKKSDCTIPQQQQTSGNRQTNKQPRHSRRSHRVNWIPSSESETFNTVVINYHYDMEHSKGKKIQKSNKIENKKQMQQENRITTESLAKDEKEKNSVEEKDSFSEFYLCKLYEESLQDLVKKTIEKEKEDETKDLIIKDIIQEKKGNSEKTHIILEISTPPDNVSEVYRTPPTEMETADNLQKTKTPNDPNEIIIISDDDNDDGEYSLCLPKAKTSLTNQNLTTSSMECKLKTKCKLNNGTIIPNNSPTHASKGTTTTSHNLKVLESKLREILEPEKTKKEENVKLRLNMPESPSNCSNQKLKIKTTSTGSTFKQRQLELHRHRIAVEVKRLELLEVKLARERDEMMREQILFEKELELKNSQIKQIKEDLL